MSASDRQPPARSGLRRLLSSDGATVAILAVAITAAVGLAGTAVAGDTALSIRIDKTNARIDKIQTTIGARIDETRSTIGARIDRTNARIDKTRSTIGARIDETNARIHALRADMDARFDRLFSLLQEHGRRLDAIERQLADRPPSPDNRVTP